jgi:hypothetical protein
MSEIKKLLAEIEAFLARTGMRPSTFGHYVVRDGKFVDRLRKGGTVNLDTAAAVRTYIATGVSPRKGVSRRPKKVAA